MLKVTLPAVVWTGGVALKLDVLCFSGLEPSHIVQVLSQNLKKYSQRNELFGIKVDGLHPTSRSKLPSNCVCIPFQVATAIWAKFSQRHHQTRRSGLTADIFLLGDSVDLRGDWCHLRSNK